MLHMRLVIQTTFRDCGLVQDRIAWSKSTNKGSVGGGLGGDRVGVFYSAATNNREASTRDRA